MRVVSDGLLDRYDRAIIISADSDLGPAIDKIKHQRPEKDILVAAPPGRKSRARALNPKYEFKPGRIAQHLLKDSCSDKTGAVIVTRPVEYDPPA